MRKLQCLFAVISETVTSGVETFPCHFRFSPRPSYDFNNGAASNWVSHPASSHARLERRSDFAGETA